MSLRSKILAVLVPVVLGYALLDHAVQRWNLEPSFARLEADAARADLEQLQREIDGMAQELALEAQSQAALERFPGFLAGRDERFLADYFSTAAFLAGRLDLAWIVAEGGEVRFSQLIDPKGGQEQRLRDFVRGRWATGHPLLSAIDGRNASSDPVAPVAGFLATELGPLVVASAAVVDPSQTSSSLGRVILGRFLSAEEMQRLSARLGLSANFWTLAEARGQVEQEVFDELTSSPVPVSLQSGPAQLDSYVTVLDLRAQPALIAHVATARPITASGSRVIRYALLSTLAAGLLLLLALLRTLQGTVLRPIAGLTAHAESIGRTDDTSLRIGSARKDELGRLGREFDSMLEKLAESRKAVISTARAAGMSEIATGILHNVGNVLNSVNVSGTLLLNLIKGSQSSKLSLVVGLLEEHQQDLGRFVAEDPRGKKLLPLLKALASGLEQESKQALDELQSLNAGLGHIKELVASQQAYATRTSLREITHLPELIEEAVTMTGRAAGEFRKIQVQRNFEALTPAPVDRHKLLEILVNVIQNARQAMDDAGRQDPRLDLELKASGNGQVAITVRDNGVGIPQENLSKIFNHGFTTKRSGHGFGLHSAANSVNELGGKLTCRSPGPGKGAEFVIEIPYTVRQAA